MSPFVKNTLSFKILGALTLWVSIGCAQSSAVEYQVEPCCNLCPKASDLNLYDNNFLKLVRVLVEGKENWLFRSEQDFMEEFGPGPDGMAGLGRFVKALKKRNIDLVMVYQPTRALVHKDKIATAIPATFDWNRAKTNYLATLQAYRDLGMIVPDMEPLLDLRNGEQYFFRRDNHWTPEGARRTAEIVAQTVKAMPAYQDLPKTGFENKVVGLINKTGAFQIAAKHICGYAYPEQFVEEYLAEATASDDLLEEESDDLFGEDDSMPPITLLGTSNSKSATNYNFDGFLKEYLQVDMINEALAGGSYYGSLVQHLPSEEFQENPPKIIIWEVPAYHGLGNTTFYRQIVPMVSGGCSERDVVLTSSTKLQLGRNEVLFNGGGEIKKIKSGKLIADIQFDSPYIRSMDATVWYMNGRKERVYIKNANRVENNGRFIFELQSDLEWKDFVFLSMDIEIKEPKKELNSEGKLEETQVLPKEVTAQLCLRDY